jgi:hypothetical protein
MFQREILGKNKVHIPVHYFSASFMIVEINKFCCVHIFLNLCIKPFHVVQNVRLRYPFK